jgi:SAM-dependent methyltransferase
LPDTNDRWAAGSAYEEFMGRWSRLLASRFVVWLPARIGGHWLDVGCGTGALSAAICAGASPASVTACDPSEPLLDYARRKQTDSRITFVKAAAGSLPARPGGYGIIASALALNFFPDPSAAIQEMRRLTAPGGLVTACVWDYAEGMQFLRRFWDCALALDPGARDLDEGRRFPICRPEPLVALFSVAGLADVVCEPLEIATPFRDFADYWTSFLGSTGPAPSYVSALGSEQRDALAAHLERSLPLQPDRSIALIARAWAVRGVAISRKLHPASR